MDTYKGWSDRVSAPQWSEKPEWRIGEQVIWVHEMRGGYGYVEKIPAIIVKLGEARVTIEVQRKSGEFVRRSVKHTSLRRNPIA